MKRRAVLANSAKIATGLFAFVPAAQALMSPAAASTAAAPADWEVIRNYVGGRVVATASGRIDVEAYDGRRSVLLPPAAAIWKGSWLPGHAVELGDAVKIWGTPQGTDFLAQKVWVNIVNRRGPYTVVTRSPNLIVRQRDPRIDEQEVEIGPGAEILADHMVSHFDPASTQVPATGAMQVIGLERANAPILATRVWLWRRQ